MFRLSRVSIVAVFLASGACSPAPGPASDTTADVEAINQIVNREIAAFSALDTATLNTVFAENVVAMPPNEPAIQGRSALIAWAEGLGKQFTIAGAYSSSDVIVAGDWAVQRFTGRLTLTPKAGGAAMSENLKGLHILRRQPGGSWQITQDVWNADQPPAAAPPIK